MKEEKETETIEVERTYSMKEKALKELKKKQRIIYLTSILEASILLAIVILLYFVLKNVYIVWIAVVAIAFSSILVSKNMISIVNQAKKDIIADKYKVVRDKEGKIKIVVDRLGFEVKKDD